MNIISPSTNHLATINGNILPLWEQYFLLSCYWSLSLSRNLSKAFSNPRPLCQLDHSSLCAYWFFKDLWKFCEVWFPSTRALFSMSYNTMYLYVSAKSTHSFLQFADYINQMYRPTISHAFLNDQFLNLYLLSNSIPWLMVILIINYIPQLTITQFTIWVPPDLLN